MDELTSYILPGIHMLARNDSAYQALSHALDIERIHYQETLEGLPQETQFTIEDYLDAHNKLLLHSIKLAYQLGKLQNKIESPG